MKQCEICNITFESSQSYSNHIRWKHKKISFKEVLCKSCCKQVPQCGFNKHIKTCADNKKKCKHCNNDIFSRKKIFCNNKCAASFNNKIRSINRTYITPEWKLKLSLATKKNWDKGIFRNSSLIFSSKNEREIINFFKKNFKEDNWKSGGRLNLNGQERLSRDMWSDTLKICFEYDGVWHFKDIKGQLIKKQYKDKLLEQWCLDNGYRLVRIDEDAYEGVSQVVDLIYNKTDSIIKLGNRY